MYFLIFKISQLIYLINQGIVTKNVYEFYLLFLLLNTVYSNKFSYLFNVIV